MVVAQGAVRAVKMQATATEQKARCGVAAPHQIQRAKMDILEFTYYHKKRRKA